MKSMVSGCLLLVCSRKFAGKREKTGNFLETPVAEAFPRFDMGCRLVPMFLNKHVSPFSCF